MPPQVGVGGGVPNPRKLSAASITMALPSHTVAMTRMGANTFGSTWRATTRPGDAPSAWAASTKVSCFTASTVPRTTRDAPGAMTSAMTRMMFTRLCPSTDITASASTMPGTDIAVSTARWITESGRPSQ